MKKYILSFLILCGVLSANCANNGDGTVTCQNTGLIWQADTRWQNVNWYDALTYCENLTLANYDDWRLPNIIELKSISIEKDRVWPSIEHAFKENIQQSDGNFPYYWSSTTYSGHTNKAFMVNFGKGNSYTIWKSDYDWRFDGRYYRLFVRCVR